MAGLTNEERRRVYEYASNGAEFFFIPSSHLKEMIARDEGVVSGVAPSFKAVMLSKDPIRIDSKMVMKYCFHKLDRKNTFILDNGDIKVIPIPIKINDIRGE